MYFKNYQVTMSKLNGFTNTITPKIADATDKLKKDFDSRL